MSDTDERFEAVRARARALGLDVCLTVSHRLYEGDQIVVRSDSGATCGRKVGRDDAPLSEELAVVEGAIFAIENTR